MSRSKEQQKDAWKKSRRVSFKDPDADAKVLNGRQGNKGNNLPNEKKLNIISVPEHPSNISVSEVSSAGQFRFFNTKYLRIIALK